LRAFQKYVAHHLHTQNSKKFPPFNSHKSNYQFDSQPFFWPKVGRKELTGSAWVIKIIWVVDGWCVVYIGKEVDYGVVVVY
jgi:hypothetical protein